MIRSVVSALSDQREAPWRFCNTAGSEFPQSTVVLNPVRSPGLFSAFSFA
ncbi:MAG: hypothetical protein AAF608_13260 [Pseudomonadota bacterium]